MADLKFWLRWVFANGCAELVGLGIVALAALGLNAQAGGGPGSAAGIVGGALLLTGLGGVEGAIVGGFQWLVLRRRLGAVSARAWILATAIGALAAWALGSLPSVLMSGSEPPTAPQVMPDEALIGGYAAALGFTAGMILAYPQWRVLRRHAAGSALWLPVNGLAWAIAMPIIFAAAGSVPHPANPGRLVGVILATAGLAGLVVGAVHGAALVWITRARRP
ncbi:MAG: hypothetical protein OEM83_09325 [Gammaproteobacteria bacterium]|nr:hypothetical protein [Gammaproteobacteria bacterium]